MWMSVELFTFMHSWNCTCLHFAMCVLLYSTMTGLVCNLKLELLTMNWDHQEKFDLLLF